ncbi:peptidase inhibitor 15-like isoform X2 [Sycon ciliatum]|uniref:peptidase inhibitor 15-like isoform X2 n=1 Tax=Sycon ciliatum TaxID=27933 RepID=UPI0031F63768
MKLLVCLSLLLVLACSAHARLSMTMQATILRAHNEARSRVKPTASNMERMVWNPTLALIAQEHAENCAWEPNDIRHAEAEHLFPAGVGENMALNYGSSAIINQNPVQFIREWVAEGQYYNITHNTCEVDRVCTHYTQMMTANTVAVGCGFHVCQEMEFFGAILPLAAFFICNYGPQGPAVTQQLRPYTAGPPCSFCPAGKQLCMDNLCEIGIARAPPALSYPTGMPMNQGPGVIDPTMSMSVSTAGCRHGQTGGASSTAGCTATAPDHKQPDARPPRHLPRQSPLANNPRITHGFYSQ